MSDITDNTPENPLNKKQRISETESVEDTSKQQHPDQDAASDLHHHPRRQPHIHHTEEGMMPQKRFYRCRAHCNPLSHNDIFEYPTHPNLMNWSDHFPILKHEDHNHQQQNSPSPDVLDIGCGFGGLTVALATLLPTKRILGIEIRPKVAEFVRLRILACRKDNPGLYDNCSVLRNNTMKYMPNFFHKASLEKIFICFPDPHFKRKNFPRRIVSERLLSEYAYFLKPTGLLYLITDVKDLHEWHLEKCRSHPMFHELTQKELDADPCVQVMYSETEEGKKVERSKGNKYYAVFQRISNEDMQKKSETFQPDTFWHMGEFGVSMTSASE